MEFDMSENVNFKKLIRILGSQYCLEINENIEKKLKKDLNLYSVDRTKLIKNRTSNLKKDQYLSLFSFMSKIDFNKIEILLNDSSRELLKITKEIMNFEESIYDSETSVEKAQDNCENKNSLDSYIKTMLDLFAFKHIMCKLQNITDTIKDQIENYIEIVRTEKDKYFNYSDLLLEKLKKIFNLDDFYNFKNVENHKKCGLEIVENSIEYLEQSMFSIQYLWTNDEIHKEDDNSYSTKRKSKNITNTKSTNANSRRCSFRNYCNGQYESKSSTHLFKVPELTDFKIHNIRGVANEKKCDLQTAFQNKSRFNYNFHNLTAFRDNFLALTRGKEMELKDKNKNSKDFLNLENHMMNKNMKIQKTLLGIIAELSSCNLINIYERSLLKELVLDNDEQLIKILHIYEKNRDIDSLYNNILGLIGAN